MCRGVVFVKRLAKKMHAPQSQESGPMYGFQMGVLGDWCDIDDEYGLATSRLGWKGGGFHSCYPPLSLCITQNLQLSILSMGVACVLIAWMCRWRGRRGRRLAVWGEGGADGMLAAERVFEPLSY